MLTIKISEAAAARRRIPVYLVDATDGYSPETGITAPTVEVSKAGAAQASGGGTWTEIGEGQYYYEATAGEVDTLGFLALSVRKTGCRDVAALVQVVAFDPYDAAGLGLTRLDAAVSAVKAKTDNLPDDPADASDIAAVLGTIDDFVDTEIATILARLGGWTGTGINTVLGAMRALANKAAGLTPTDLSTGGTFDNTTDSGEALRDRGDAAWGAGGSITPPVVYYQGNLNLTSDEPTVDGIIRRYAGDPLRIAVRLSTGEAPANIDGYTLVPVLKDSAGASASGITADIALGPNGEATIDGTTPAATGIWRLTVRLDADGQTFGPLIVEVI
jgi:hypothetical protein